ncbi:hypothetical protein GCK32_008382 [Trichostrongylus colubriformis]|uniref:Uncharacterized protein n=1 Tax=Trichostrongylus colubriformis TaxID=6319 RepID=A0AAN8G6V6_TRICO
MDLSRSDQSHCDDYLFGAIPDDEEHSYDGAADEIDAINDETFGDDVQVPLDSELEDYAAQTACLRLDDGAPWDTPGCSKEPAPDASNVPLPDFDVFRTNSFSSFGSETMAKLDSLWSQRSHNLYDIWGEQKNTSRNINCNQSAFEHSDSLAKQPTVSSGFPLIGGISQLHDSTSRASAYVQQRSPVLPAMPQGSTLEDLERSHMQRLSSAGKAPNANIIPPVALNATDLERRFIEEAAGIPPPSNQVLPPCNPSQFPPPLPSPHSQLPGRVAPNAPPSFGGVAPMHIPPLLPPLHPMMLPFVPFWLEHLAGRAPCLPPGCPPVPPLLRMFFDTVKDPMVVMNMIRASNAGMVPPPFPLPQTFDRRSWQRKPPGMPSGRTIEDLAFDQFAGYIESASSEISRRIDVIFQDLMTEDFLKILQIGKGRSVVARALTVGTPRDVARIILSLFSVMSLCPKKCLEDINCEVVPHVFTGVMRLSREQLVALSSAMNIDSLKENIVNKNVFCRDAFITFLYACAKRKAISQGVVRWLSGPPDDIDFTNGWSSSLSVWREQLPDLTDSDIQIVIMAEAVREFWNKVVTTKRLYLNPHEHFGRANIFRAAMATYIGMYFLFRWNQKRKARNLRELQSAERVNILNDALARAAQGSH